MLSDSLQDMMGIQEDWTRTLLRTTKCTRLFWRLAYPSSSAQKGGSLQFFWRLILVGASFRVFFSKKITRLHGIRSRTCRSKFLANHAASEHIPFISYLICGLNSWMAAARAVVPSFFSLRSDFWFLGLTFFSGGWTSWKKHLVAWSQLQCFYQV